MQEASAVVVGDYSDSFYSMTTDTLEWIQIPRSWFY